LSLLTDCEYIDLDSDSLHGPNQITDESAGGGGLALNIEYLASHPKTRNGFKTALVQAPAAAPITSLYSWLQSLYHRLLWFEAHLDLWSWDFQLNQPSLIVPALPADGVIFAEAGSRIYLAWFDYPGTSTIPAKVWNGIFTLGIAEVDDLFRAPLAPADFTAAFADGAGTPSDANPSAGQHNFKFLWQTANGFITAPTAQTYSFSAAGGLPIQITLTPTSTWPTWVRKVLVIMTTAQNLQRYFVVPFSPAPYDIMFGTANPLTIEISESTAGGPIDDASLPTYEDATKYFSIRSGGMNAYFLLPFGNRMVYLADVFDANLINSVSTIYISEPDNFQWVTEDQHAIRLPGARKVTCAAVLGNIIYWLGPNWTFASSDNTLTPVEWVPPELVDGSIGTTKPRGVTSNPAIGVMWVADQSGLYAFSGGAYPRLPTSYYQSVDWKRINWGAPASTVQVVDSPNDKLVIVMAPLDGSNVPTHLLVWNYQNGVGADKAGASYSLWSITDFTFGSIAVVLNSISKELELWIGSSDATGKILRQKSSPPDDADDLYNDEIGIGDPMGIDSRYRTGSVLPKSSPSPLKHVGAHFRIRGSGDIEVSAISADGVRTIDLVPIEASSTPERDPLRLIPRGMQSESCRYEISNGDVRDAWFLLARIRHYYTEGSIQRGH
jgi:hypothetical protein